MTELKQNFITVVESGKHTFACDLLPTVKYGLGERRMDASHSPHTTKDSWCSVPGLGDPGAQAGKGMSVRGGVTG